MAKKTARRRTSTLNRTAETIGASLGRLAAQLDAWKAQRSELVAEVTRVLHSARGLLGDLGETRRGEIVAPPPVPRNKGGRPRGYQTSEATKRKLRAAWKRRKASMKPGKRGSESGGTAGNS